MTNSAQIYESFEARVLKFGDLLGANKCKIKGCEYHTQVIKKTISLTI